MLLIKPHPFQVELDIFNEEMSNIKVITNEDLNINDVNLYSLLGESDSLLTDYSSVYFDYLILDKPIGFTIDDFSSYEDKRGFVVDNPLEIMPGMKIYTVEDLEKYIVDLSNDIDLYSKEREKVNNLSNQYKDDQSAKRVLKRIIKQNEKH